MSNIEVQGMYILEKNQTLLCLLEIFIVKLVLDFLPVEIFAIYRQRTIRVLCGSTKGEAKDGTVKAVLVWELVNWILYTTLRIVIYADEGSNHIRVLLSDEFKGTAEPSPTFVAT